MRKNTGLRFSRLISFWLALLLLLTLLSACGQPETPAPTPSATETPTVQPDGDDTPTPTEVVRVDHGITRKYEYEINTLHWYCHGGVEVWIPWEEIAVEQDKLDPSDLLASDIYDRNAWLEENYGITVTTTYGEHGVDLQSTIINANATGADDYQLFACFGYGLAWGNVLSGNVFCNLNDISTIDFSHPWWNAQSIETMQVGNAVEFAASDMLLLDKGATTCVYFNKTLATDLGILNVYDDVRNGDWTLEKMMEYAELANIELDGNDQHTAADCWGVTCGDDPVLSFYLSSGNHFIEKDEDGYFVYSYGSDDTLEVMTKIFEKVMYSDCFYNQYLNQGEANMPSLAEGRVLFEPTMVKACNSFRRVDVDYGILPNPMCDDFQDTYYSWVHSYHDTLLAIPGTTAEPETVGAALELLSYYSYYNIYNDLYETVICDRGARDTESIEMLKVIFSNRVYDIGVIKDAAVGYDTFTNVLLRYTATHESNMSAMYEKYVDILDRHIATLNETVDDYR